LLNSALDKIANFEGLSIEKVYLTGQNLKRYQNAVTGKNIKNHFCFNTKSRLTATNFVAIQTTPNVLFRLQVKTGKDIEKLLDLRSWKYY